MTTPVSQVESQPPAPVVRPARLPRRAYVVLRSHPRALLLPLLVTQAPLAVAAGTAYFVLFFHFYPSVATDSFEPLRTGPDGLKLSLAMINAVYLLFTAVGLAATVFAANAVLAGRVPSLAESLDPAFTRMGGLLALGALFQVMLGLTFVGAVMLVYFIVRFALAFHVFMLEKAGVRASLARSWSLLKRRMFRFMGSLVVPTLLILAVLMFALVVLSILAVPFASADAGRTETLAVSSIAIAALGVVAVPCSAYFAIATTILYLDFRSAEIA